MSAQRRLILTNYQSPGDIVMLTAAVRDLQATYPGEFLVDVRTSAPQLWYYNPYLTGLSEADPAVEIVDCHYPLVHRSNELPYHFVHGFRLYLNDRLGLDIRPTAFRGDIHLSTRERRAPLQADGVDDTDLPLWLVAAGGKHDYTIKWWSAARYQEVVHALRGRVSFVQVGAADHYHPPLEGVIDLRGKTNLRELVRLVHRADGVLCGVTLLMHLAAAVETQRGSFGDRPCVVVAGAREPAHFEAYPQHQFLHRNGTLPCCATGGCWRSRTVALGDGSRLDAPEQLCVDVTEAELPRCMDMVSVADVVRSMELYL